MRIEDFGSQSPGRLVPTEGGVDAYVPNPLPPQEGAWSSVATMRALAKAENALGQLVGTARHDLLNPHLVAAPLIRREAIISSRIEGTYTTPRQLALIEAEPEKEGGKGRRIAAEDEAREVLNYVRAVEYGFTRLDTLPMSKRLMRELHEILMKGVRGGRERPGQFRDRQNYIAKEGDTIQKARFVPPPVAEMEQGLDDLEKYMHRPQTDESLPLLIDLALVHYQFETLHPFRDGSGRIGRLMVPLILSQHGRLATPLLFVSGYLEQHKRRYMDLLLKVSKEGAWLEWIEFFLDAVRASAVDGATRAKRLLALRQEYVSKVQSARSSALLVKLIDELFHRPSITFGEAAKLLDVTPAAANANVRKLQEAGVLTEITGQARNMIFAAQGIFELMHDSGDDGTAESSQE